MRTSPCSTTISAAGPEDLADGALAIAQDDTIEPDETLLLTLGNPSEPASRPDRATELHLLDDDLPATDLPASSATKAALTPGDTATGTLEAHADHDWFAITLAAGAPYRFDLAGTGDDAIAVSAGENVIDAGGGSNFIVTGIGRNHAVLDARNPAAPSWSTVTNFGFWDSVAVMGISEATHHLVWQDNQGQSDHQGLTLHAFATDGPTVSLTFPGLFAGQVEIGVVGASFQAEAATGTPYLFISGGLGLPYT